MSKTPWVWLLVGGGICAVVPIFCCGGCMLMFSSLKPDPDEARKQVEERKQQEAKVHAYDEEIVDGDFRVRVRVERDKVDLTITNGSPTKVLIWNVWRFGSISDEHGNEFRIKGLPDTPFTTKEAIVVAGPGDAHGYEEVPEALRFDPTQTKLMSVFYQAAPAVSKTLVVTVTANGRMMRFASKSQ